MSHRGALRCQPHRDACPYAAKQGRADGQAPHHHPSPTGGRTMQARIDNPAMTAPGAMQALQKLGESAARCGVPQATRYLVVLRASQINGCSVCVDMHTREMRAI